MRKNVLMMVLIVCLGNTICYSQSNLYDTQKRTPNMRGYKPIEEDKIEKITKVKVDTVAVTKVMIDSVLTKMGEGDKKRVYTFNEDALVDYRKGFTDGEEKRGALGPIAAGCCLGPIGTFIINEGDNEPEIYPGDITDKELYRQGYKNSSRKSRVNIAAGTGIILIIVSVIGFLM